MIEFTNSDVKLIQCGLRDLCIEAEFSMFGSTALGRRHEGSDVDIAVIVKPSEKESAIDALRQFGGNPKRACNWTIDVFSQTEKQFGYNRRHTGMLHLLVLDETEYYGDTALARNIREVAVATD